MAWDEELAEVREVLERLAHSVPSLGAAADPLLGRLETLHASVPPDLLVSAHHDFRPAQVLLHDGRIGFIDFDGACRAEPALDLGRFRAKLRDIGISAFCASGRPLAGDALEGHLRLLDELCDDFLDAYQRHAPGHDRPRRALGDHRPAHGAAACLDEGPHRPGRTAAGPRAPRSGHRACPARVLTPAARPALLSVAPSARTLTSQPEEVASCPCTNRLR